MCIYEKLLSHTGGFSVWKARWSCSVNHVWCHSCSLGPTTMMSEGTKNIVEAMKSRGIRKVIGCMSGMTRWCREEGVEVCAVWLFDCFPSQPSSFGIAPKCRPAWFPWQRTMTGCTPCWRHRAWTMWLPCLLTLEVSRKIWSFNQIKSRNLFWDRKASITLINRHKHKQTNNKHLVIYNSSIHENTRLGSAVKPSGEMLPSCGGDLHHILQMRWPAVHQRSRALHFHIPGSSASSCG